MKIAIMGIRGIPANYGGFETFAEEMAPRLVQLGHEVTVFGRSNNVDYPHPFYKGVRLRVLPTIRHKYLDTVFHTLVCVLASFFTPYDVVLICNSANSLFSFIPRLTGKKVVVNVDGLEWKRKKWNWLGKAFYRVSEVLATILPNAIVTDARSIQQYYLTRFGKASTYIPYGVPEERVLTKETLQRLGVQPRRYLLYVSRLEPENNAHLVIEAFERVRTDMPLLIVGDAPYSQDYIRRLRSTCDPRIIFTGYVFGQGYKELQSHAYLYMQATEVGGTHPALLEGMGFGNCVVALDVPEHREVLGDAGIFFVARPSDDLVGKLQYLVDHPQVVEQYRQKVRERARACYSWDAVTRSYERLFSALVDGNAFVRHRAAARSGVEV
ncbi:MAG: glycosyltransferase [bacterium]|jgi:glycosyltransferase involved in cell wall biosynthesis|nr:glycosyltransferase [candidate division KSB1 bacterium]MDH7559929.1 glycosyltransferase [bacterium]